MKNKKFYIYSFYRFFDHKEKKNTKKILDLFLSGKFVRGTILLADEGINGTISGEKKILEDIISFIKKELKIRKLNIKINQNSFLPFNRIKVRLKKEIVSLGKGDLKIDKQNSQFVSPADWNRVVSNKKTIVIDVRNQFEIDIGKFKNSLNPKTDSFRDFPKQLEKMKINKDAKIAMYCTGGIRCEKASVFMKIHGYKNIVQLDGGIINYLDYKKKHKSVSIWKGECFVFDERITINENLLKGKYLQCYGCRRPITKRDTLSVKYKKGVCCSYCFNERSESQKKRSFSRQKQIDMAYKKNSFHTHKKIIA